MSQGFTRQFLTRNRITVATGVPAQTNGTATDRIATGTTITASGTHTKGSYATLISSLNNDAYGLSVVATLNVASGGTDTGMLCDIAYDSGGGDVVVVPNINFGYSSTGSTPSPPKFYNFYGLYIPSGAALKARIQSTVSADTLSLLVVTIPNLRFDIGNTVYTDYGSNTATSHGASVTPASGAFGTWTEIGTTSADHYIHVIGLDGLDNTIAGPDYLVEVGYGPNSGSVTSMGFTHGNATTNETMGPRHDGVIFYPTTSGTKLFVRIAGNSTEGFGVNILSL